jgi:hypothetical protein
MNIHETLDILKIIETIDNELYDSTGDPNLQLEFKSFAGTYYISFMCENIWDSDSDAREEIDFGEPEGLEPYLRKKILKVRHSVERIRV